MSMTTHGLAPGAYDEETLRELRKREKAKEKEREKEHDPNYECQNCGNKKYIDDHMKNAPAWCGSSQCETVRSHRRIEE
jgi:hypothetical protein